MSALDISQQGGSASPSPTASPVSSPTAETAAAPLTHADPAEPAKPAEKATPFSFTLTPNERRGLVIVLGVALFQEVPSNVFRGVLVGAAAAAALYSQRSCVTCKPAK